MHFIFIAAQDHPMDIVWVLLIIAIMFIIFAFKKRGSEKRKMAAMSPAEQCQYLDRKNDKSLRLLHGTVNPMLLCPHCQQRGLVRSQRSQQKKGVSGAKATGALLTSGISLLFVGLSRKETVTTARCGYCESVWQF